MFGLLDSLTNPFLAAAMLQASPEKPMNEAKQLPRYRCHKEVSAFNISGLERVDGVVKLYGQGHEATVSEEWIAKHSPGKGEWTLTLMLGGYYVLYDDGYKSFSPAAAFEEGYARIESGATLDDHLCANTASHVTVDDMNARRAKVDYHRLPNSTVTICSITLDNGFSVRGESACVDPERFDKSLGEDFAYKDAFEKLWPLFGFLLAEKRHIRKQLAK